MSSWINIWGRLTFTTSDNPRAAIFKIVEAQDLPTGSEGPVGVEIKDAENKGSSPGASWGQKREWNIEFNGGLRDCDYEDLPAVLAYFSRVTRELSVISVFNAERSFLELRIDGEDVELKWADGEWTPDRWTPSQHAAAMEAAKIQLADLMAERNRVVNAVDQFCRVVDFYQIGIPTLDENGLAALLVAIRDTVRPMQEPPAPIDDVFELIVRQKAEAEAARKAATCQDMLRHFCEKVAGEIYKLRLEDNEEALPEFKLFQRLPEVELFRQTAINSITESLMKYTDVDELNAALDRLENGAKDE